MLNYRFSFYLDLFIRTNPNCFSIKNEIEILMQSNFWFGVEREIVLVAEPVNKKPGERD